MHSALYTAAFYALPLSCELLEGLLLWRLCDRNAFTLYPYLTAFIAYDLVRTPALLLVAHFWHPVFPSVYRTTDLLVLLLDFLLFWEVARRIFRPESGLGCLVRDALLVMGGLMLPATMAFGWGQMLAAHFPAASFLDSFDQYSSLAQAVLLLMIAAIAQYYRIALGRNMRALIFTFGPYLLLNAVGFASYQVFRGFAPYLELIPAATYIGMIAIWLWAFWEYAPSPNLSIVHLDTARSKAQWNHVWQTTLTAMRRSQN